MLAYGITLACRQVEEFSTLYDIILTITGVREFFFTKDVSCNETFSLLVAFAALQQEMLTELHRKILGIYGPLCRVLPFGPQASTPCSERETISTRLNTSFAHSLLPL